MINADKYLKDGVENIESLIKDFFHFVGCIEDSNRYNNIYQFFLSEVKPTLSEDEKVILRNIECFKESYSTMDKIHRTKDGDLYITKFWIDFGEEARLPYKHLFQFIKPRRRI